MYGNYIESEDLQVRFDPKISIRVNKKIPVFRETQPSLFYDFAFDFLLP